MEVNGSVGSMSVPTQEERRAATSAAVVGAARALFAGHGFDATSIDDIAARAGVTKGAVYHYFDTKEALFRRVFEQVEEELVVRVATAAGEVEDPVESMRAGARAFLEACTDTEVCQIALRDGPTVLGWETWRELDAQYFLALVTAAVQAVVQDERRTATLSRLFVGAIDEGALLIAKAEDPAAAMADVLAEVDRLIAVIAA